MHFRYVNTSILLTMYSSPACYQSTIFPNKFPKERVFEAKRHLTLSHRSSTLSLYVHPDLPHTKVSFVYHPDLLSLPQFPAFLSKTRQDKDRERACIH
eukprot:c22171_g2_i1 orf=271-564(+)